MFHRRYSSTPAPQPATPPEPTAPAPAGFTHQVQMPAASTVEAHREKLRQRLGEGLLQKQLIETEQELDGIIEEEKELARRREELQVLNERQTGFHDRRLLLEDRINEALLDFEKETRQRRRDIQVLDSALGTCRRHLDQLEQLAPQSLPPLRSISALQRQKEFLADFERRLARELGHLGNAKSGPQEAEPRSDLGLGDSFRRGLRFFLPYLGVGAVGLLLFLSLTGGGH